MHADSCIAHAHSPEHDHPYGLRGAIKEIFAPHSHGAADSVDDALESSAAGIRAVKISLVVHKAKANGQVDRVLELFPVLKEMLQRKGGVLSGGQQQQLAIARA